MANFSENLSMTIGDLSLDTGLLDITCSGLLSSPDSSVNRDHGHDISACSCHGEKLPEILVDDVEMSRAGEKESPEGQVLETETKTDYSPDNILSPAPAIVLPNERGDTAEGHHSTEGLNMMGPPSENMSLFNDTSFNISKALSRVDKNETFGGYNFSYADSTKFYSLVQNLEDFITKEDDEDNLDNGHDSSFNSMGEVEINEEQVSFRNNSVLSKNQRNEFLLSNGDLNVENVHHNALAIEENFLTREKITKDLAEALEACLKSNEEKDREIDLLKFQIEQQQQLLASKEEEKKRDSSPLPDTFSTESDPLNSQIEDLKLQVADLEKKLDIEKKYLGTQTAERELEQDDYQRQIAAFMSRNDELIKDKGRLEILVSNQKTEIEDFEMKLKETLDAQDEVRTRSDNVEHELKNAVEKIHELRHIIGDLEKQIDETTKNAKELKDQNHLLQENLERIEKIKEQEEQEPPHEDTIVTVNTDLTEELHAQVEDLAQRLQRKLNDMDNFQWSTRPNSSCSNAVSVSNEDISVSRDLGYINKDHEYIPQDLAALIMDGFRKLDGQFESLVRFEEIIMKKLRDSEIRVSNAKKTQEDLESEKQILLDKLRAQTMKISDLENCLDQSRFEPNPNAVTLSGLRARVTALKAEVEESQGKLHLKELELQDLTEKISAKDALLTKLTNSPQHVYQPPAVQKHTASCQTERRKQQNSSVQTEDMFKVPNSKSFCHIAVQTQVDALEISSIQGVTPVTHSTPNEGGSLVKAAMRNLKTKKSNQSDSMLTNQISDQDRTPEILRDPTRSRMHVSFMSDKMPRLQDLKQLEIDTVQKYDSENGDDRLQQRFDNLRDAGSAGSSGVANESGSGALQTSRGSPGTSGGYDGDRSYDGSRSGPGNRNNGGSTGRENAPGGRPGVGTSTGAMNKDSQTPPLALANLVDALDDEEKKRLFQELNKAENLSPIIQSKNEEMQRLMDRIKQLESGDGRGGSSSRGRNAQDDQDGLAGGGGMSAAGTSGGARGGDAAGTTGAAGSCIIETTLNFDDTMKPTKADTRMNYVVNAKKSSGAKHSEESGYGSRKDSGKLSLTPELLQEAKNIYDVIGCDLNAMAYLNITQYQTVLQVLTAVVQSEFDNPDSESFNSGEGLQGIREPEQIYTYELETVCDFQLGNNGDLTLVNAQGRVIPSESHARVSSGAHPLGSGGNLSQTSNVGRNSYSAPNNGDSSRQLLQGSVMLDLNSGGDEGPPPFDGRDIPEPPATNPVDWERLQKDKERRLNEADCLVELNTLKTNMELLRQAYEQEKAKNKALEDRLTDCGDLVQQLGQERGTANELRSVIDQQQQQVNMLTQSVQQLQARDSNTQQGIPNSTPDQISSDEANGINGADGRMSSPAPSRNSGDANQTGISNLGDANQSGAPNSGFANQGDAANYGDANQPGTLNYGDPNQAGALDSGDPNQAGAPNSGDANQSVALNSGDPNQAGASYSGVVNQTRTSNYGDVNQTGSPNYGGANQPGVPNAPNNAAMSPNSATSNLTDAPNSANAAVYPASNSIPTSPGRGRTSGLSPSQRVSNVENPAGTSMAIVLSNSKKELVNRQTQKWFELYLRAKSYRKALAWQKKYLSIVIQGYKDLLGTSGAAFEHPDLLQRQVPITPSSVGLCDRKKGKKRFRIIGKVVLAAIRMKYMVNRWNGKITIRPATDIAKRVPYPESSRYGSPSSSSTVSSESDSSTGNDNLGRTELGNRGKNVSAFSPPTKDDGKIRTVAHKPANKILQTSKETHTTVPHQRTSSDQRLPRSQHANSCSSISTGNAASGRNINVRTSQISQYLERFQHLENEIGSTISRLGTNVSQRERRGSEQ